MTREGAVPSHVKIRVDFTRESITRHSAARDKHDVTWRQHLQHETWPRQHTRRDYTLSSRVLLDRSANALDKSMTRCFDVWRSVCRNSVCILTEIVCKLDLYQMFLFCNSTCFHILFQSYVCWLCVLVCRPTCVCLYSLLALSDQICARSCCDVLKTSYIINAVMLVTFRSFDIFIKYK